MNLGRAIRFCLTVGFAANAVHMPSAARAELVLSCKSDRDYGWAYIVKVDEEARVFVAEPDIAAGAAELRSSLPITDLSANWIVAVGEIRSERNWFPYFQRWMIDRTKGRFWRVWTGSTCFEGSAVDCGPDDLFIGSEKGICTSRF